MKNSIRLAKKYLLYAESLDRAGISDEAIEISLDVARFLDAIETHPQVGKRFAVRGNSYWNDYLQSALVGAGGGAATGAVAGAMGGPLAAVGAGGGAILGGLGGMTERAGADLLYGMEGNISKANLLAEDFQKLANQLSNLYIKTSPDVAQKIVEAGQILKEEMDSVYQNKKSEIAAQYGLDPNAGFWQNVKNPSNWGKMIGSKFTTLRSQSERRMTKLSDTRVDPGTGMLGGDVIKGVGKKIFPKLFPAGGAAATGEAAAAPAIGGVVGSTMAPIAAGVAAGYGTSLLYNKAEDLIKGREGKEKYLLSEMGKITDEIGRLLNNPNARSFMDHITRAISSAQSQQASAVGPQTSTVRTPENPAANDYSATVS